MSGVHWFQLQWLNKQKISNPSYLIFYLINGRHFFKILLSMGKFNKLNYFVQIELSMLLGML